MNEREPLLSIQVLRGFAALSVVIFHAIRAVSYFQPPSLASFPDALLNQPRFYNALATGVDVFFVISGFIMVLVAQPYISRARPLWDFVQRRIVRIYPPYLIVTAITLLGYVRNWLKGIPQFEFSIERILGAITLFPTRSQEGIIRPILGVGWTLSYEMYFYLVFAASIFLFGKRFLAPMAIILASVSIVGNLIGSTDIVLITFLSKTITMEFLLGCFVGTLYRTGRLPKIHMGWAVVSCAVIMAGEYYLGGSWIGIDLQPIIVGIPAAVIVAVAATHQWTITGLFSRALVLLGDASYSIYLVHALVITHSIKQTTLILGLAHAPLMRDSVILGVIVLSVAAGVIFHLIVERNLRFQKPRKKLILAPTS